MVRDGVCRQQTTVETSEKDEVCKSEVPVCNQAVWSNPDKPFVRGFEMHGSFFSLLLLLFLEAIA